MLKAIFSTIATALRGVGGLMKSFAAAPGRMLMSVLGGGGGTYEPPEMPSVAPPNDSVDHAAAKDRAQAAAAEIALIIQEWCAQSVMSGDPVQLPPELPSAVKSWVRGLSRSDAVTLLNAEERAISAHIQGVFAIPGLPAMKSLPPVRTWPGGPRPPIDAGLVVDADNFTATHGPR